MPASPTPARPVTLAHLAQLLFLGAVWGGAFLFMHTASPEIGPVWTAEIRIAIGGLILVAIFGRQTWLAAREDLVAFAIAGAAFSAIPFTLISFAVLTLPVGFGAILNASTPLFTALLTVVWLGERMTTRTLVGLLVGIGAVIVLVGWSPLEPNVSTLVAVLAALGAALGYAFGGTFVRRRLPGIGGTELATGQLVAGAILLLPFAIATGAPATRSPTATLALLAIGTLSTALPWPIYMRLLRSTTPTIASSVTFVVPAFAITWGAIVLGESIGPELIVGFGMIIVSLVLVLGLGRGITPARFRAPRPGSRREPVAPDLATDPA